MNKIALKNGILLGLVSTALILLIYIINIKLYLNEWLIPSLGTLLALFFMFFSGRQLILSNKNTKFINIFIITLITFLIGKLINLIFVYCLYHFIDPNLAALTKADTIRVAEKTLQAIGANDDQIENAIATIQKQEFSPSLIGLFQSYLLRSISGIILSIILSKILMRYFNIGKQN